MSDIQTKLDEQIPWEEITFRAANRAKTKWLAYVSGEYVKRTLNDIYGWDGWGWTIKDPVFREQSVCVHGTLVVFENGEDMIYDKTASRDGLAVGTNANGLDFAAASGSTDALKRAAATLGNRLGLQLYAQRSPGFQQAWDAIGEGHNVIERVNRSEKLTEYEKDYLNHFYEWMEENK